MDKSFGDIANRLRRHADEHDQDEAGPRNFEELYLLRARILGVLIRDARQEAGLSLDECARVLGVPPSAVTEWELGKAMPSLPQLELLAYALQVPISHFWGTQTLMQQAHKREIEPGEYVTLRGRIIGGLLRAAREQRQLTPQQLADESGVSVDHIRAYELGRRPIGVPVLSTLAQVCGVSLSYFLEDGNRVGDFLALQEDMKRFTEMPEDMRRFVAAPVNQSYIELAMRLAHMSTGELRGIAEAILEITL